MIQSIRIITLDSYMSSPIHGLDVTYSEFRGSSVSQVPILRLFGSTLIGEKICVHIHGVFPYLYIPYDGSQEANSLMYRIAASIDKAVNISLNQATSNMQHVYKITLVQGIPMYGYHSKEHQFFKIYLYNPLLIRKVTVLLANESTLGSLYQPYEAHLSFTLQFMIDYNLHGMSNMILSKMKYRSSREIDDVDPEFLLPPSISKMSVCKLEGDCLAEDILNREEVASGNIGANPGIAALWADEQQRRRNKGLDSQIKHLLELERTNLPPTNSHLVYKQALGERLAIFSNEKNAINKLNSSVYPAETPPNIRIQNASMLDSQTSNESSLVSSSGLDDTIGLAESSSMSITFDEDAHQLLEVLNQLEEQANEKFEEDSILTQLTKEEQDDKEIEGHELDFSMSLEAATTPTKIVPEKNNADKDSDDDLLDKTLIPQLDGCCDETKDLQNQSLTTKTVHNALSHLCSQTKRLAKVFYMKIIKTGRDMPDLDKDYPPTDNLPSTDTLIIRKPPASTQTKKTRAKRNVTYVPSTKNKKNGKRRKLTRNEKKAREIIKNIVEVRRFEYKINKLKRQDQLAAIMKKLHKKENDLILFLEKNRQPRFRTVPKDQVKSLLPKREIDENKTSKVKILSNIIVKLSNYIDPTLHFIMKYPNHCCYLFNYNNNFLPEVTRIPRKICQSPNKEILETYIKMNVTSLNWFINEKCKVDDTIIEQNSLKKQNITKEVEQDIDQKTFGIKVEEEVKFINELNYPIIEQIRLNDFTIKDVEQNIDKKMFNVKEENIFSDKYLADVKDPSLVEDMHKKSEEDIKKIAENLKEQLKMHIQYLSPSFIKQENVDFACEEERMKVLNNIKCLKTEDHLNLFCENDTKYEINISTHIIDDNKQHNFQYNTRQMNNTNELIDKQGKSSNTPKKKNFYAEPIRRSNRIKNRQTKYPLSLDGALDSDTSSEEEEKVRKGNFTTPSRDSRYKALPITVEKSPKRLISVDKEPAVKDLVSFTETLEKETPPISRLSQNPVCDMNVKRQLFEVHPNPLLNKTVVEEKLVCGYSPTTAALNNICDTTTNIVPDINEESIVDSFHEESNLEEVSNSSTIFSTDSDKQEQSFFHSEMKVGLTIAEKYDKTTNYKAKEGCSKMLTPLTPHLPQSGSSSDFLTPYQQPKVEHIAELNTTIKNVEVTEEIVKDIRSPRGSFKESLVGSLDNYKIITVIPKFSAPTRKEVLKSLDGFKIPLVLNEPPHYSNLEDVTGTVEVGFNTLKISSTTTAHLTEFESQTDTLNNFRKARLEQLPSSVKLTKSNINNVLLSFCRNKDCIITPVKKPPDLIMITDWLAQKSKKTRTPEHRTQKIKIRVPVSPGGANSDDDLDLSLTLSPVTPSSSSSGSTPKSVRSTSPVVGNEYKKRRKEIRKRILSKSVQHSLSLSQENSGQITGVTVNDTYLNRSVQNLQNARAIIEHQNLTVLVMELHIRTRGDLKPDPAYDSMRAIFYSILHDVPEPNRKGRTRKGIIAINSLPLSPGAAKVPILDGIGVDCDITYVDSEENLVTEFLKVIDYWDPDIYTGYEIELLSWGYLIKRGYVLGLNLKPGLGRIPQDNDKERDGDYLSELKLTGRIVLDGWRLMRHEIAVQSYTFESVAYHILQKRLPRCSFKDLSFWWDHRTQLHRHRTVKYYVTRVVTLLELFDKLDFLGRTSELARLFGILFFEVLSRGSQFRVESMMLRLAKPLNFVAVSPSIQQRAHMKAPEYIALVMEPESKLYTDPVIVLDFQSLYPSIIIAYNYCFTTCVGRVESLGKSGPFQFGTTQLKVSRSRLKKLFERNQLNFSPCGVGFVKKEIRDGILPRMLREILDTRLMVKNSMKENKDDKILQKVFHNRQLGLKLIANVTYGYTSANFSGRMPAVEIGDSVVSKGRETLQRAIELVDKTPEWGARVVYGDTDSLFVLVPGRTKEHAFEIGKQIAEAVTNDNPDPIKLKLEKVYKPCILQTKKRYVGYMYESPDQKDPVYEAKGIETVRRDGCPAVRKMLEKCLRILFETKDVSLVKKYVMKQFNKIIAGRVSIQDLTFAKEYRGADGYRPGACVPALELTKKWTALDKRNEPRSGERVPYIIINGPPGLPLIRLVRSPRDLLNDPSLKPNAIYYITRVIIPPINRCFNLIGADLHTWFNQMPRKKTQYFASSVSPNKKKTTISQYFSTSSCISCEEQTQTGICQNCCDKPQSTVFTLMEKMRMWETNYQNILKICQTCTSSVYEVRCISLDCPVYYKRVQTGRDEQQSTFVRQLLSSSDFDF